VHHKQADIVRWDGVTRNHRWPSDPWPSDPHAGSQPGPLQNLVRLLWTHITPRRRLQLLLLVSLMVLSSFAELLSVASLVPLLAVLSDPAGLWRQPWLRPVALALGLTSSEQWIFRPPSC